MPPKKNDAKSQWKTFLLYAAVPIGMIIVQVAGAALLVTTVNIPEESLSGRGGAPELRLRCDSTTRWQLWSSREYAWFAGLPFNGSLTDPQLLTLRLLKFSNPRVSIELSSYDKKKTAEWYRKVEKAFNWRLGFMRWIYRVFGSDFIGFVILTLCYWVALYCVRSFSRLWFHFGKLSGFWDRIAPGTRSPRKLLFDRVDSAEPWKPAEEYLNPRWENPEPYPEENPKIEDCGDGDCNLLPHKILRAAIHARKLYMDRGDNSHELAWQYYREQVAQIMEAYENRLAQTQYFAQIIAPLGFIGTVLHLGLAMGHAQTLSEGGGIGVVTSSLGMAFDTTFVALVLWIIVEFVAMNERKSRIRVRDEAEKRVRVTVFASNSGRSEDEGRGKQ